MYIIFNTCNSIEQFDLMIEYFIDIISYNIIIIQEFYPYQLPSFCNESICFHDNDNCRDYNWG